MNKYLVVTLAFLVSACAVGPDYERAVNELPDAFSDESGDETNGLADWWLNFDDPQLIAFIEESLAHNNDLKIAVANVDTAAAALQLERADYLLTVNAQAGATRADGSEAGAIPSPPGAYTEYRAGLVISYELDIWGRVRRANEAALAELKSDIAVRDGVRAAVAAAVARAWFETRALDQRIALLERLQQTRIDNLRLQKVRLDAGLISPYDYEQSRAETAAVEVELPGLRAARQRALTALAVLRGLTPRAMFAQWRSPDIRESASLPAAPDVPMGLPSELLERRPDIRAAEQRLVAANARIGEAKAAYFPSFSLTGFAGGISTAFSGLGDSPAQSWQAGIGMSVPLTDLGRIGANADAARAHYDAVTAAYAKTVQIAFQETFDALNGVTAARAVMRAQDERVAALTSAYRVAEARYEAGRIGYLEMLDVERQLREIEQQQVNAQLRLLQATVDLYRALGGGWHEQTVFAEQG